MKICNFSDIWREQVKYHFISLWFDPSRSRTHGHDLPHLITITSQIHFLYDNKYEKSPLLFRHMFR